jgi:hypothetical protein
MKRLGVASILFVVFLGLASTVAIGGPGVANAKNEQQTAR